MDKKAIYYEDTKGRKPAKDFINQFDDKTRAKILARVNYLEDHWKEVRRPLVDKIDKDLYELRIEFAWNNVRVIYAYMFKNYIVLLHGLQKKTDILPENDKLMAKRRMSDFQIRYNEGKIKFLSSIKVITMIKRIKPEFVSQHIERECRKSQEFRRAYDEEVLRLKIAYKITQLRKTRHLTQQNLAKKIGTSQQNISRLEDSRNTQITLHTLVKLAKVLKARLSIDLVPQE